MKGYFCKGKSPNRGIPRSGYFYIKGPLGIPNTAVYGGTTIWGDHHIEVPLYKGVLLCIRRCDISVHIYIYVYVYVYIYIYGLPPYRVLLYRWTFKRPSDQRPTCPCVQTPLGPSVLAERSLSDKELRGGLVITPCDTPPKHS